MPQNRLSQEEFEKKYGGKTAEQATPGRLTPREISEKYPDMAREFQIADRVPGAPGWESQAPGAGWEETGNPLVGGVKALHSDVMAGADLLEKGLTAPSKIFMPGAQGRYDPLANINRAAGRKPLSFFSPEGRAAMGYEPRGTGEEIGAAAARAGEEMLPAGQIAGLSRKAPRGFQLLTRAGLEGGAAAGFAGLQGQDPATAGLTAGGASLGLGATVAGAKKAAPSIRNAAESMYARVFSPTSEADREMARKVTGRLMDTGTYFRSRPQLAKYGHKQIGDLSWDQAIEVQRLSGGSGPHNILIPFDPLMKSMDDVTKSKLMTESGWTGAGVFTSKTNKKAAKVLGELKESMKAITHVDKATGQRVIPYSNADKFKSDWQHFLSEMGRYEGKDISTHATAVAKDIGANAIMDEFKQVVPNISKIDKDLSFWMNVTNAVEKASGKKFGKSTMAASRVVMGGEHEAVKRSVMYTKTRLVMAALEKFANSPAFTSVPAQGLNKLSKALASGNMDTAQQLITRYTAAAAATPKDPRYPVPVAGETGPTGEEPIKWTPGMKLPE